MITRRTTIVAGAAAAAIGARQAWAQPAAPALGRIRAVTTTAQDLRAVEAAYTRHLGYRVVERGRVPAEAARSWGAPAVAGRGFLAMAPEAGEPTLLRFVQQSQPAGFRPMTTFGWNSTEIIVQDPDALEKRLQRSPFRIVGRPKFLASSSEIRAMQAIGPANEMLYLTAVVKPLPPERDMPKAEAFVGRCFIAVLGGPDIPTMSAFYLKTFGRVTSPPFNSPISTLSVQNRLPPETRYDLAVMQLGGGTKLELDDYPPGAGPRPRPAGGLPPGMAMVSFECRDFERFVPRMAAPPKPSRLAGPLEGRRSGVVTGAVGELIELVEA
jgi:catechol 2,3-dioxygenase-like lactoylglutathione lyase family enzyme